MSLCETDSLTSSQFLLHRYVITQSQCFIRSLECSLFFFANAVILLVGDPRPDQSAALPLAVPLALVSSVVSI